jgi:hypothetical protein
VGSAEREEAVDEVAGDGREAADGVAGEGVGVGEVEGMEEVERNGRRSGSSRKLKSSDLWPPSPEMIRLRTK